MYIDTIKSRVQAFFRHLDISQKDFNASIGVKAGFINTDSEPTGQILSQIIRAYPQLSPDWLLTGSGPMLRPLREHPNVTSITATVHDESSSAEYEAAEDSQHPSAEEPTQPYASAPRRRRPPIQLPDEDYLITIPRSVLDALSKQLENKDAQIATLLTKIPAEA